MDKEERRKMIKKKMDEKKRKEKEKDKDFFHLSFHFKKKTLETEI